MYDIKKSPENICSYSNAISVMRPVSDALDVLYGKWRIPIIISLLFGNKRFKELSREVEGISDKMLAKELKDLEINQLIKRTVHTTYPPIVEYSITEHGKSMEKLILELRAWGSVHRKEIIEK